MYVSHIAIEHSVLLGFPGTSVPVSKTLIFRDKVICPCGSLRIDTSRRLHSPHSGTEFLGGTALTLLGQSFAFAGSCLRCRAELAAETGNRGSLPGLRVSNHQQQGPAMQQREHKALAVLLNLWTMLAAHLTKGWTR